MQTYSYGSPLSTGTIRQLVYQDPANPFGAGDLSFVYQVTVDSGDVGRITGSIFGGTLTDVGVAAGVSPLLAGSVVPDAITRSNGSGDVIGFNFTPAMTPASTSVALIIRTNATTFQPGSIGVIDGGGQTLSGFAPTPIPEPASLVLLSLGAAGIFAYGRKRSGSS